MLKNFTEIINEAVEVGCNRGIHTFIESLDEDLNRAEILSEYGFKNVLAKIYENSGYSVENGDDDDLEAIDESKLDKLLETLENGLDEY